MKLHIVKLGRVSFPNIDAMVSMYEKRLSGHSIQKHVLRDASSSGEKSKLTPVLKKIFDGADLIVGLDERGKSWSSDEFVKNLQEWQKDARIKSIVFVVGGPFGWDVEIDERIQKRWCLSPLTLQGDVAWLVLWEQLYRASTIRKGGSYHH